MKTITQVNDTILVIADKRYIIRVIDENIRFQYLISNEYYLVSIKCIRYLLKFSTLKIFKFFLHNENSKLIYFYFSVSAINNKIG